MTDGMEDPKTYFAAERTFLAWIRTGLGLMGVGFAISRFGLFLRQLPEGAINTTRPGTGISLYSGVALVALGVTVNIGAVAHHIKTVRELRIGTWLPGRISTGAVALALLLALVGIGEAIYLLFLR